MNYRVKDTSLVFEGKRKIDWAEAHMPVLVSLRRKYEKRKPLKAVQDRGLFACDEGNWRIGENTQGSGTEISWCGCNPLGP